MSEHSSHRGRYRSRCNSAIRRSGGGQAPGAHIPGSWNDYAYGIESWGYIRVCIKQGVTSYSAWNMVLDTVGKSSDNWPQNALLTVNTSTKALVITPAYYVFRHVSQFVDPGAKVLGTSGSSDALAFKNPDGTIVTILYKSGAAKTAIVAQQQAVILHTGQGLRDDQSEVTTGARKAP